GAPARAKRSIRRRSAPPSKAFRRSATRPDPTCADEGERRARSDLVCATPGAREPLTFGKRDPSPAGVGLHKKAALVLFQVDRDHPTVGLADSDTPESGIAHEGCAPSMVKSSCLPFFEERTFSAS